ALSILYYIGTYYFYNIATYRYSAIFASSLPFALGASLYWINKIKPLKNVSLFAILMFYVLFILNALYVNKYGSFLKEFAIYTNMFVASILVYLLYNLKTDRRFKNLD